MTPAPFASSSSGSIAPASAKAATQIWSTVETSGALPPCTAVSSRCWYSGIGDGGDLDLDAGVLGLEALHRLLLVLAEAGLGLLVVPEFENDVLGMAIGRQGKPEHRCQ